MWDYLNAEIIRRYAPSNFVSGTFGHSDLFVRLSANPGGGKGGLCFGDSGSPVLVGGTDTVIAVNSFGTNGNCAGVTDSYRVDTPACSPGFRASCRRLTRARTRRSRVRASSARARAVQARRAAR